MSVRFLLIYFLLGSLLMAGNPGKVLLLNKIDTDFRIDGIIDPVWSSADSATEFFFRDGSVKNYRMDRKCH